MPLAQDCTALLEAPSNGPMHRSNIVQLAIQDDTYPIEK
jgi:hypothetical protein